MQGNLEERPTRIKVLRPCRIQGAIHQAGEELTVPLRVAIDCVLGTRCEAIDPMPRVTLFGAGAIGPGNA